MANIKFSAFTAGGSGTPTTARVAGFKNLDTTQNYYYTITDLTEMILGSDSGLTAGSVVFAGAGGILSQDNANFFWDDSNNRLGIGVADPDSFLEVYGGSTQQKWSFDGDSSCTIAVIDDSHTTIKTAQSGNLILTAGGNVGIGVTDPDATLEVFSTSSQVKLSYDGTNETSFAVNSTGDITITPSGGSCKIAGQGYTSLKGSLTTMTFNWDEGNIQSTTIGGVTPLTFIPNNPKRGATYILTIIQTGTVTVDWDSLVKWPLAAAPVLSGNLKTDIITLICYNDTGAGLYYGTSVLNYTTA